MPNTASRARRDQEGPVTVMARIGYALSSEEHEPRRLVENARAAEEAGFEFALISDHYHPWIDAQGHSSFVWSVLGGIAGATKTLEVGTGVTCPTIRIHPAIIAQAAATVGAMMPGRFFLGVGTGENLNEHVLGDKWPEYDIRAEMLEESLDVIRLLWEGEQASHYGAFYTVENARVYDVPDPLPKIHIAAGGTKAAELAGRIGDGLIATAPEAEVLDGFRSAGGDGKPTYGQITLCWGENRDEAVTTAHRIWPTAAIRGEASQELPAPAHFEQLVQMITPEQIAKAIPCGPDPEPVIETIREYERAGFDHIYLHQVGPDQAGFLRFAERELLPVVGRTRETAASTR
jgi:coenzyme F420-dependent glucose-6-phosphate dehydrogenase